MRRRMELAIMMIMSTGMQMGIEIGVCIRMHM